MKKSLLFNKKVKISKKKSIFKKNEKVSVYNIGNLLYIICLSYLTNNNTQTVIKIALKIINIIYSKKIAKK